MKKYRFWFHYYKPKDNWSLHYRDKCYYGLDHIVTDNVSIETHSRKSQPRKIVRGFAKEVKIQDNVAYIS